MNQSPLLFKASEIIFSFQEKLLFKRLSVALRKREHFAIVGPNGTGKSTLLGLMSGTLRLSQIPLAQTPRFQASHDSHTRHKHHSAGGNGTLHWYFSGTPDPSVLEAKQHSRLVSPAQQTTYARQEWRNLTGQELVLSGFDNTPLLYGAATDTQVAAATQIAQLANLGYLLPQTIHTMSQGQLRSALLMRALISKPALLLLDEPFDGLDTNTRKVLFRLMELASTEGSTLVVTAHKAEDIPAFIKHLYSIEKGQLAPCPTSYLHPAHKVCNTIETLDATDSDLIELLKEQHAELSPPIPECIPVLQMKNIDVFIERNQVLHSINWKVNKNEHWIIKGRNGAGKSTLLRLSYGEEFIAYGGQLLWFGKDHTPLPDLHAVVGYVSDRLHQQYQHDISSEEVVCSGFSGTIGLYETIGANEQYIARKLMHKFDLTHLASRPYHSLSTGEGKRVLLARALAKAPPVLLLDEPFSGLDPANRKLFLSTLPLLAAAGSQILFISHDLPKDNAPFFTHELRLSQGKIQYAGPAGK